MKLSDELVNIRETPNAFYRINIMQPYFSLHLKYCVTPPLTITPSPSSL